MPVPKELEPDESLWAYLGARLRFYRTAMGLSQAELASQVHSSASFVSAVETGERRPKIEFIQTCDGFLNAGGDLVTVLRLALKDLQSLPAWVQGYAREERRATRIRTYQPQVIPGLLQSEPYARALFEQLRLPESEIERLVAARMARQEILHRTESAPRLWAVIDESALNRLMADPALARDQLAHLLKLIELPHVIVEILPVGAGLHAAMDGNFVLLDVPGKGVIGYSETFGDGRLVTEEARIEEMELRYDLLRAATLSVTDSARFLRRLLEDSS
ncbi:helix-turn-helix domain-containing protein [Yinghuangia sp. YIM S10712]|uniref:helix-turn-helix domain-containing protein n=1 Tax=Yinghuangia sp. YIM S10712 TaxID=3436930 RepID=UPI003F5331F9